MGKESTEDSRGFRKHFDQNQYYTNILHGIIFTITQQRLLFDQARLTLKWLIILSSNDQPSQKRKCAAENTDELLYKSSSYDISPLLKKMK
jgi:hypothetical protein